MKYLMRLIVLLLPASALAQIEGEINVTAGQVYTYYVYDENQPSNWYFDLDNGGIVNQWEQDFVYYVNVQWYCPGNAQIRYYGNGSPMFWKNITVSCPVLAVPSSTFSYTNQCRTTILTRTANPPAGTTWFWQNSPTGTETAHSASTYAATSPGIYYLRARSNGTPCCWSNALATASVTVVDPMQPSASAVQRCGPGSVTLNATPNGGDRIRWYDGSGNFLQEVTSPFSLIRNVTQTTTFQASSFHSAANCESVNRTIVTVTVNPLPAAPATALAAPPSSCGPTTVNLQATGAVSGETYNWYTAPTGGTALGSSTQYVSGTTTFYASKRVTATGCESGTRTAVTVSIFPVVQLTLNGPSAIPYGATTPISTGAYHSYQWTLNGNNIAGATNSTWQAREPGTYNVKVKGSASSVECTSNTNIIIQGSLNQAQAANMTSRTRILQAGVNEFTSLYTLDAANLNQEVTYTDGLGRTFQTIAVGAAPHRGDLVSAGVYGKHGMVDTTYLPYATTLADGRYRPQALRSAATYTISEQYLFYQGTAKVATSNSPFARTIQRASPDFMILEQGAPGADWQPAAAHTTRHAFTWNDATTYRVLYWKPDGTTSGNYPANSVAVSITTDENDNRVRTYTNALGQTVLKQVEVSTGGWLETYYIFDEFGRLKYEVPPKAVQALGTGTDVKVANLAELIFTFTYDSRNRLVEKKVPGSAPQFIIYDDYDRVLLTQDGNLRSTNRWVFMKYDRLGRVVYSGLYTNTSQTTRAAVQALVDALNYNTTPWFETEGTTVHGYTNLAWPTTGTVANTILAVNYYDHYNFDRTAGDDFTYDNAHFSGQPATRSTSTRGMATGSKRNVLDANGNTTAYWITGAVFYDHYDRAVQTQTNNHLHTAFTAATLDKSTIVYDFVKALRTKTSHYQNATTAVHLEDRNEFDHAGRVIKNFRRINGGAEQQLAQYEYNALGQLVDKKLHNTGGSTFLQSVDYRYNIRGWLTSINNAQLIVDQLNDETTDYFGLELSYNTVVSGLSNTPHYNGNISAVRYKTAHAGAASLESTNGTRSFKYTYDKSDRLTAATFAAQDNSGGWTKQLNTLNETMTYDANGNILTLARNQNNRGITTIGGLHLTGTAQTIDQLTYTYASAGTGSQNSNLMIKVEDAISGTVGQTGFLNGVNTATEYTYTVDGSLTADQNKGISSIVYNFLGKPQTINYNSGRRVEYTYDAAGTKLTVRTYQAATLLTTTNYSGGFVYEGASPALSFFSSPEGRVVRNGANFEYQYAIADHQGNTRLIFSSVTPAPVNQTATFENPTNDATVFGNVPTASPHWATFVAANNTPGGNKVIRLNQNYPVAATRSIRVYPGETVSAEVWCYYEGGSYGSNQGITPWITAVASAFGGVSGGGGESGSIFNGVNNAIGTFGMSGNQGTTRPAAYLNYIIFDQQYKVVNMGWTVVPTTANFAKQKITVNAPQIKEPGFVFVYLSYENAGTTFVNFDDIQVTHTRNNIIQYNEYYAFQHTTANSWTRENVTGNNFLGNGGTEVNTTTQLYDLDFRNYDPLLGRMTQVDPMAAKYASLTPYNYSFNDPVTFTDANGADPLTHAWQLINGIHAGQGLAVVDGGGGGGGGMPGSGYHWSDRVWEMAGGNYTRDYFLMSRINFDDKYSGAQVWNPWYGFMDWNDPETAILLANKGDDPRVRIYLNQELMQGGPKSTINVIYGSTSMDIFEEIIEDTEAGTTIINRVFVEYDKKTGRVRGINGFRREISVFYFEGKKYENRSGRLKVQISPEMKTAIRTIANSVHHCFGCLDDSKSVESEFLEFLFSRPANSKNKLRYGSPVR